MRISEIITSTNIFLLFVSFSRNSLGKKIIIKIHNSVKKIWDGLERLKSIIAEQIKIYGISGKLS